MKELQWNVGQQKSGLEKTEEQVILVGVILPEDQEETIQEHLDELDFLARTAGAKTVKVFTQRMKHPDNRSFIGTGKADIIKEYIDDHEDIVAVIFDDDLTGKQVHNLEEILKVKIIDRSTLILDIFAERAQTAQAQTQVELAQMQYLLPRLRGLWTHLERQRGGIGMRGPGEKEIETDRRIVRDKISRLRKKLADIDRQSSTRRKRRDQMVRVSLIGYTNVGKSTILNRLAKTTVLAENKLFATLDTTVRKIAWQGVPFLMSDTVGFIRKLPHHLVESFKSTLDEVRESDLLLHVVDISHPNFEDHMNTVTSTLEGLDANDIPTIIVFNKMDAYRAKAFDDLLTQDERQTIEDEFKSMLTKRFGDCVFISALDNENINEFRDTVINKIKELYISRYPHIARQW